jgi:hypothetical protein
MPRPKPVIHGCDCPPGEFVVIMPVEAGGVMHEFIGAGAAEDEADSDAERHAVSLLGEDCIRYPSRPA